MSHVSPTHPPPAAVSEGHPVTNLTLVVLLLIPCVVILLLLNCLFLGYKFVTMSRRHRPQDPEDMLLHSRVAAAAAAPHDASFHDARRVYVSVSEPVLHPHPVTSSRASSRERAGLDHRIRLLRPDGATGSGSLRAPSTIRATSFSPRLDLASGSRSHCMGRREWCRSAPVLAQSSDSEAETRVNLVPPNSPMPEAEHVDYMCRGTEYKMLPDVKSAVFDKVNREREYNNLASETSAVGPGLDSDFGASAGVSLRILSADSDGLSNGVLNSALEWDYYDPCYVKQNNLPRHKHHRPAMHTKQYWV